MDDTEQSSSARSETDLIRAYESEELAKIYAKYRFPYPAELQKNIIEYLEKKQLLKNKDGKFERMLDVGCSSGTLSTQPFSSYFQSVLGVDISEAKIEEAKKLNIFENVSFEVVDGYRFPVEDNSIDLITCATSIHFLNIDLFEKECERVLKQNGCCVAYVVNFKSVSLAHDVEGIGRMNSRVMLNSIMLNFEKEINMYACGISALNGNQLFYDKIKSESKEWIADIIQERKMTLADIKNCFRTFGAYVKFMENEKPVVDPLDIFGNDIRKALGIANQIDDADIVLIMELNFPVFAFSKTN